jgi:hypothetical protein
VPRAKREARVADDGARSAATIRSAELRVRLPRHHFDMLVYRAEQQETVSGVLERELDGIASAHIEELSAALPGFAEAMAWPGEGC